MKQKYFVYIVKCADGTLYTGCTTDVKARVNAHNLGRGAKYTAARRPVKLVYSEKHRDKSSAMQREWEIKRMSRAGKESIIRGRRSTNST